MGAVMMTISTAKLERTTLDGEAGHGLAGRRGQRMTLSAEVKERTRSLGEKGEESPSWRRRRRSHLGEATTMMS